MHSQHLKDLWNEHIEITCYTMFHIISYIVLVLLIKNQLYSVITLQGFWLFTFQLTKDLCLLMLFPLIVAVISQAGHTRNGFCNVSRK
jgi:hypothetical protein